jgi:hypothetical protein
MSYIKTQITPPYNADLHIIDWQVAPCLISAAGGLLMLTLYCILDWQVAPCLVDCSC